MKLVSKKDSAVSPVIGTILLVAITVILVAIIAAVVMPMVGGTTGAATIGVQVVPGTGETDAGKVIVSFTGGDYAKLTSVKGLVGNDEEVTFDTINEAAPSLGVSYPSNETFDGLKDVKIIGTINGNEQIIWQGKLNFPPTTPVS